MNDTKKILSVQDISCYGQCSNTVMLPVLSAGGLETVALPTALLSTHTAGFPGFTFLDLTEEMEKILAHFMKLGLHFDWLCTGYFGSAAQIEGLKKALPALLVEGAPRIIDPVMGDNGNLYSIYDENYVKTMRTLCAGADVITPNLTEACLLADEPFTGNEYDAEKLDRLFAACRALGARRILLTGVMFDEHTIGVAGEDENGARFTARAPYAPVHLHGTGDTLTGSLIAFLARGFSFREAARRAVNFVADCIADTLPVIDRHFYGLRFEGRLGEITAAHP